MSHSRVMMIWTGAVLTLGGLALIVLRLIGAHNGLPLGATLAPLQYYGAASGLGIVGLGVVRAAPKDRRKTRRVRLDEAPVQENATLRPSRHHGIPTTSGFGSDPAPTAPVAPKPRAPDPPRPAPADGASAPAAPRPAAPGAADADGPRPDDPQVRPPTASDSPARSAWGKPRAAEPTESPASHPNAAILERPRSPSTGEQDHAPPAAAPDGALDPHGSGTQGGPEARDVPPIDAHDAVARLQARRMELMSRLDELEQKANQAKVRYGLGKVSAAGYRQYLAEVDRERMMIESELMETEE